MFRPAPAWRTFKVPISDKVKDWRIMSKSLNSLSLESCLGLGWGQYVDMDWSYHYEWKDQEAAGWLKEASLVGQIILFSAIWTLRVFIIQHTVIWTEIILFFFPLHCYFWKCDVFLHCSTCLEDVFLKSGRRKVDACYSQCNYHDKYF